MNEMYPNNNQQMGGYPNPNATVNPQQQQPMPNNFNVYGNGNATYGFNQNGTGVVFGNITQQAKSTLTPEEQKVLDNLHKSIIEFTNVDKIKAADNFRRQDGTIELTFNEAEGSCTTKYGDKFTLITDGKKAVERACKLVYDIFMTTKLCNTSLDDDTKRELYIACGIVTKILPEAYAIGLKDWDIVQKQIAALTTPNGYMGNPNMNMYGGINNGQFGGVNMPQFVANLAPGQNPGFATGYGYAQPQPNNYNPMMNNGYYYNNGYVQQPMPQQNYVNPNNSPFYGDQPNYGNPQQPVVGNISPTFNGQPNATPQMNIPNPGTPNTNQNGYQPNTNIPNPNNDKSNNGNGTTLKPPLQIGTAQTAI